jgi:hypothetical protein
MLTAPRELYIFLSEPVFKKESQGPMKSRITIHAFPVLLCLLFLPGNIALGASTTTASITDRCTPRNKPIEVPAGSLALRFSVKTLEAGLDCETGKAPEQVGFEIRRTDPPATFFQWSQNPAGYKASLLADRLEKLVLGPGSYELSVRGGKGAEVVLQFSLTPLAESGRKTLASVLPLPVGPPSTWSIEYATKENDPRTSIKVLSGDENTAHIYSESMSDDCYPLGMSFVKKSFDLPPTPVKNLIFHYNYDGGCAGVYAASRVKIAGYDSAGTPLFTDRKTVCTMGYPSPDARVGMQTVTPESEDPSQKVSKITITLYAISCQANAKSYTRLTDLSVEIAPQ